MRMLTTSVRHRDFRLLWAAQATSELGDSSGRLALAMLIYARTGSAAAAALVVAVSMAAWLGPGQLLAGAGDRFSRRSVLISCDVIRCAAFLAMLLPVPSAVLLLLAGAAGLAAPPFAAARAATVPDTVPAEDYPEAIALTQVTNQLTLVAGFSLSGVVVARFSPEICLVFNAASFALSAALIGAVRVRSGGHGARERGRLLLAARTLVSDRPIRLAVILTASTAGCAMAAEALVVPLAREVRGGPGTAALFAIAVPAGTVLATCVTRRSVDPYVNLRRGCVLAVLGGGVAVPAFANGDQAWLVGLGLIAAGVVFAVAAPTNAVIGPRLPADLRASAFGWLISALVGSQALGAAAGGVVAQAYSARTSSALFLGVGTLAAFACVVACRAPSRPELDPQRRSAEPAFLASTSS